MITKMEILLYNRKENTEENPLKRLYINFFQKKIIYKIKSLF